MIYHSKTIVVPDSTNTNIQRPSDWNAAHIVDLPALSNSLSLSRFLTGLVVAAGTLVSTLSSLSFANNGNVSFGLDSATISATAPAGGGGAGSNTLGMSNLGNTSGTSGTIQGSALQALLAGGNNITLSQSINGQSLTITISGPNTVAQSNQTLGVVATGNTTQSSSGTIDARSVTINGGGIVSAGVSNGSILVSATVPAQTVESNTLGMSNLGNTAGTSGVVSGAQLRYLLAGGNNITLSQSINGVSATVTISAPNQTAESNTLGMSNLGNTSGTSGVISGNQLRFLLAGGNNVTLSQSINGASATITISGAAQSTQSAIRALGVSNTGTTAGNTGVSTGVDWVIAASGNITASQSTVGGGPNTIWLSVAAGGGGLTNINVSAGTTSNLLSALTFANSNGISFGLDAGTITASHNGLTSQTNQTVGLYATSNTTQSSSGTADARSLTFAGAGVASVGVTNGSVVVSVPAGGGGLTNINVSAGTTSNNLSALTFANSNGVTFGLNASTITASIDAGGGPATASLYALGNTTQNSSTALDVRSLSFNALGAMTWGYSNGSIQVSAPATSSLSATGMVSISTNGSTISIGVPVSSVLSGYVPYPFMTGSNVLSLTPGSTWFQRVDLPNAVGFKHVDVVLNFNVGVPTATSQASTGTARYSYSNKAHFFVRQDFGANSTRLSHVTSGSFGLTAGLSYSSSSQSFAMSWVTNSTGGTTSTSVTSSNAAWSNLVTGRKIVPVPLVTTLSQGEYFFGLGHSSTTGTTQQNTTLLSVSVFGFNIAQQSTITIGVLGSASSQASLHLFGIGFGPASVITTDNTMAASVITLAGAGAMPLFYLDNNG